MGTVGIADAKAHLSELVERASGGEAVQITSRGKPIAQIVGAKTLRKRIDIAALRAMVETMPMQAEPGGEFIHRVLDEARYGSSLFGVGSGPVRQPGARWPPAYPSLVPCSPPWGGQAGTEKRLPAKPRNTS